jgi:hypothetical protein
MAFPTLSQGFHYKGFMPNYIKKLVFFFLEDLLCTLMTINFFMQIIKQSVFR